jgi:histidinol-phosphate aminotransferase
VLLRTFSKIYGLAGLRVGYALAGDDAFVTAVNQVRQPFFCSAAAQAAGRGGAQAPGRRGRARRAAIIARVELESGLHDLGILPAESQANFSWFDLPEDGPSEADVVAGLASRGVLVRAGTALGREGALRVTYGTPQQNERFLRALGELLGR